MIKIIKGTYGHFDGRKVIPITEADGPQRFDEKVEARLVKKGVAVYVEEEAPQPAGQTVNEGQPEYDESMKLSELKEIAEAYGVDASKARSKAEVIAMIEAAQDEAADADDEEPPAVGAAMPE